MVVTVKYTHADFAIQEWGKPRVEGSVREAQLIQQPLVENLSYHGQCSDIYLLTKKTQPDLRFVPKSAKDRQRWQI